MNNNLQPLIDQMPVISKFYGIFIRILFKDAFKPHFHAFYGDSELIVGVAPLRIINGDAPARVKAMVLEWAAKHQQELIQAWNQSSCSSRPLTIEPLA